MTKTLPRIALAALLAISAFASIAQAATPVRDSSPAQIAASTKLDVLKFNLQLQPGQLAVWNNYATTEVRAVAEIDQINALKTGESLERHSNLEARRDKAAAGLYAALTAKQKKVFDADPVDGATSKPVGIATRADMDGPVH